MNDLISTALTVDQEIIDSYEVGMVIWERCSRKYTKLDLTTEPETIEEIDEKFSAQRKVRLRQYLLEKWILTALVILLRRPDVQLTWPVIDVTDDYMDLKSTIIEAE